jgi:hypothetical protein
LPSGSLENRSDCENVLLFVPLPKVFTGESPRSMDLQLWQVRCFWSKNSNAHRTIPVVLFWEGTTKARSSKIVKKWAVTCVKKHHRSRHKSKWILWKAIRSTTKYIIVVPHLASSRNKQLLRDVREYLTREAFRSTKETVGSF